MSKKKLTNGNAEEVEGEAPEVATNDTDKEEESPIRVSKRAKTPKSDKKDAGRKSSRKRSASKSAAKEESESEEEDTTEYEVNKIVDVKTEKGKKLFLVNWKGYGKKDNSWEPESNLSCTDLIDEYYKVNDGKKPVKAAKTKARGRKKN